MPILESRIPNHKGEVVKMSHRMWPVWIWAVVVIASRAVLGQEIPVPPAAGSGPDLPFSRSPSQLPGPPRSMGEAPFGQTLPPSDRVEPRFGPPRSMGESPFRPLSPYQPGFPQPGLAPSTPGLPPLVPGLGPATPGLTPMQPGVGPLTPTLPGLGQETMLPIPPVDLIDPSIPGMLDPMGPGGLLLAPGLLGRTGELPEPVPGLAIPPQTTESPTRIDGQAPGPLLTLEALLASVDRTYPPFLATLERRNIAGGEWFATLGAFDLFLNADSRNFPLGYYRRSVHDIFLEQPVFHTGGRFFAGYRLAEGQWPIYYVNLLTRGGGAFVSGFEQPLMRNLRIDARRAAYFRAELERRRIEPVILRERIQLLQAASRTYWNWVAAGQSYALAQELLAATLRQSAAITQQVQEGALPPFDLIAFQNLLLQRQQQLVSANREFQRAGIALSLYFRDERGLPTLPDARNIPLAFPQAVSPEQQRVLEDVNVALQLRPEILDMRLRIEQGRVDLDLARNDLLPNMNLYVYNEQNFGDRLADLGPDHRPNILEASLLIDVPLQRRYGRGRVRAADATLRQLSHQARFVLEQIQNEVLDAVSAVRNHYDALTAFRNNEMVVRTLEEAERARYREGASTLLLLYIRVQATYDAQIQRVAAEGRYFGALADYRAALGIDAVPPELMGKVPAPVSFVLPSAPGPVPTTPPPGTTPPAPSDPAEIRDQEPAEAPPNLSDPILPPPAINGP